MRLRWLLVFALFACTLGTASAQGCAAGTTDGDLHALQAAPSCPSAFALYGQCSSGPAADLVRAAVVEDKCRAAFNRSFTPLQQRTLDAKRQFCHDQFDRLGGSLALLEVTTCRLQIAVDLTTDPAKALLPLPTASFDCKLARSPMERAVCHDPTLGRYDLLLAQSYGDFLHALPSADRAEGAHNEYVWLQLLPVSCSLTRAPPSRKTALCLRTTYRQRIDDLSDCTAAANVSCLVEMMDARNAKNTSRPGGR